MMTLEQIEDRIAELEAQIDAMGGDAEDREDIDELFDEISRLGDLIENGEYSDYTED